MSQGFVRRFQLIGAVSVLSLLAIGNLIALPLDASERLQPRSREVRLLVPVETGYELEQVLPQVPFAQLVQIEGREYVQLASFADARVAYRLGRSIQKRTKLPFELAYDQAHPQSDGRWLAQEHGVPPSSAITHQVSPKPTLAVGTGKALLIAAAADRSRAVLLGGALVQPRGVLRATADQPVATSPPQPSIRVEISRPQVLAVAPRQQAHDPAFQSFTTARTANRAVPLTAASLVRPHLLAVNANLNYLFVKLQTSEQLPVLRRHAAVVEMGEHNGQLLARVGVFTPTREGRRLLHQQASRLAASGYELEIIHVKT